MRGLAVVDAARIGVDLRIDVLADELDRAVGESEVGPVDVLASGILEERVVQPSRLADVGALVRERPW